MDKYRIDYAYETVYIYDEDARAYLSYGSFFGLGVDKSMSESEIVETIRETGEGEA